MQEESGLPGAFFPSRRKSTKPERADAGSAGKRQQAKELRATARSLAKAGEPTKALAAYDQAIALWPSYFNALLGRAKLLLRLKRIEQGRKALLDLIDIHPREDEPYRVLIGMLIVESRLREAAEVLERFRSAIPESPLRAEIEQEFEEARAGHISSRRPVGEYGAWIRIRKLNVTLNRDFREAPGAALNNVIRTALAIDCFETAIAVAQYALAVLPTINGNARNLVVGGIVEALIAVGRREEAWNLLKAHPTAAGSNESLFSFFCAQVSADGFQASLAQPRPNQLNGYYISLHTEAAGALPLIAAAQMPEAFRTNPQNFLLIANYFRGRDHRAYFQMVNQFLSSYEVGLLAEDGRVEDGISLASFRFQPQARATVAGNPLVSVLMAARNAASTIAFSVESILSQTYENLELLICDDGSSDETRAILSRFTRMDRRVRVFGSEQGQGPYNIRNHLIERSKGAFITFQDADDVTLPQRLHVQVEHLSANSEQWGVAGRWVRVRPNGSFIFFRDNHAMRLCTVSLMIRREAFERFGLYDQVRFGADSDMIERIRSAEGQDAIAVVPRPFMFGLWSDQSLTRSAGAEIDEEGYRSPMRRHYAELRMRERLRGEISDDPSRMQNHVAPSPIHPLAGAPSTEAGTAR